MVSLFKGNLSLTAGVYHCCILMNIQFGCVDYHPLYAQFYLATVLVKLVIVSVMSMLLQHGHVHTLQVFIILSIMMSILRDKITFEWQNLSLSLDQTKSKDLP